MTEELLRKIRIVVTTLFVGVLCVKVIVLPDFISTEAKVNTVLDNAIHLETSTQKFGHEVSTDYYDPEDPKGGFYRHIQDDLYYSSQSSKDLSNVILDTNANINGGINSKKVQITGVLPSTYALITDLDTSVKDLTTKFGQLTDAAKGTLEPLKKSLGNIDTLSAELADKMAKGGDITLTIQELNKALDDTDKLIADPNIKEVIAQSAKAMGNVTNGTQHLASVAETMDDVTLPWRKKIGQLRLILNKILDVLKITIPLK